MIDTFGSNIYGSAPDYHIIYIIMIETWSHNVYSGLKYSSNFIDGTLVNSRFHSPAGITIDKQNNIYIADYDNNCIRLISTSTSLVTTLSGGFASGYADGDGMLSKFLQPSDLITNGIFVLVIDSNNHAIRQIQCATGYVLINGICVISSTLINYMDNIQVATLGHSRNWGICASSSFDILFIVDKDGNDVSEADITGNNGPSSLGHGFSFNSPVSCVIDSSNRLFVTDDSRILLVKTIEQLSSNINVTVLAGVYSGTFLSLIIKFNVMYCVMFDRFSRWSRIICII